MYYCQCDPPRPENPEDAEPHTPTRISGTSPVRVFLISEVLLYIRLAWCRWTRTTGRPYTIASQSTAGLRLQGGGGGRGPTRRPSKTRSPP